MSSRGVRCPCGCLHKTSALKQRVLVLVGRLRQWSTEQMRLSTATRASSEVGQTRLAWVGLNDTHQRWRCECESIRSLITLSIKRTHPVIKDDRVSGRERTQPVVLVLSNSIRLKLPSNAVTKFHQKYRTSCHTTTASIEAITSTFCFDYTLRDRHL